MFWTDCCGEKAKSYLGQIQVFSGRAAIIRKSKVLAAYPITQSANNPISEIPDLADRKWTDIC